MKNSSTCYTDLFLKRATTLLRKMKDGEKTIHVWANGWITETTASNPTMHYKSNRTLVITRKAIARKVDAKPRPTKGPVYHKRRDPSDTCSENFHGIAKPFSHGGFPGMMIHCWGKDFGGLETYTMEGAPGVHRVFPCEWDGERRYVNTKNGRVTWKVILPMYNASLHSTGVGKRKFVNTKTGKVTLI